MGLGVRGGCGNTSSGGPWESSLPSHSGLHLVADTLPARPCPGPRLLPAMLVLDHCASLGSSFLSCSFHSFLPFLLFCGCFSLTSRPGLEGHGPGASGACRKDYRPEALNSTSSGMRMLPKVKCHCLLFLRSNPIPKDKARDTPS